MLSEGRALFWGAGLVLKQTRARARARAHPPGVSPEVTFLLAPVREPEGEADPQRGPLPGPDTPLGPA